MEYIIVKDSKIQGKGVFAARDIKKGEVVIEWHPKILTDRQVKELSELDKTYLIQGSANLLMQPPERYVNHSCDPNTKALNNCDIAIKDIKRGEEITSDYAGITSVSFVCKCGSKNCRGLIS